MERKYMMYEGEEGNSIDPLYEQETDQPNGVKVILPVKPGDRWSFITKIKSQLAYFESVFFNCGIDVSNTYNINRSEHFQYSDLSEDSDMHICLDNVYYPLDFTKLGIRRINVPIGLRFGLRDGLFPTPNREALRYTPEAKQTILAKIALVADYFVDKYNEHIVDTTDLNVVFQYYESNAKTVMLGSRMCDIVTLIPFSTKVTSVPLYKGIKYLNLKTVFDNKEYMLKEYTIKYTCRNCKISEVNNGIVPADMDDVHYYIFEDKVSGNKREYMKSILYSGSTYYFVTKTRSFTLGNSQSQSKYNYYGLLRLYNYPKHLWRKVIKEYQLLQQIYISKFKDYETIQIPKSWLDERKKKKIYNGTGRRTKLHGQIFGKECVSLEKRVQDRACKLVPVTLELENLHKFHGITVYTSYDDADVLDPLFKVVKRHPAKIRCVAFSDREMKLIKTLDIHNFISYEKFMEGKNMPFKRLITAFLIDDLMRDQSHVFDKRIHIETVSLTLYNRLKELSNYRKEHFNHVSSSIFEAMLEVAQNHQLFDPSIYTTYLEIKELLAKLPFINSILKQSSGYGYGHRSTSFDNVETHSLLVDMFKYHKQKVNLDNYKISLNPDPIVEDTIVEQEEDLEEQEEIDDVFGVELTDDVLTQLQEQV